jgi:hypothetical protein
MQAVGDKDRQPIQNADLNAAFANVQTNVGDFVTIGMPENDNLLA